MPIKYQNIIAIFLISMVYLLVIAGPESYENYAVLRCDSLGGTVVAKFDDMNDCVNERELVDEWRYCGCHRPYKEWTKYYYSLLIPFVFAVAGLLLLRGKWWLRFSLLNVAIVIGGYIILAYESYDPTYDPEGGGYFMIYVGQLVLSVSAIFLISYWGINYIKGKSKNAT